MVLIFAQLCECTYYYRTVHLKINKIVDFIIHILLQLKNTAQGFKLASASSRGSLTLWSVPGASVLVASGVAACVGWQMVGGTAGLGARKEELASPYNLVIIIFVPQHLHVTSLLLLSPARWRAGRRHPAP